MAEVFINKMYFKLREKGWSENFYSMHETHDDARVSLSNVVDARMACFDQNTNAEMVYASVSSIERKFEAAAIDALPMGGTVPDWVPPTALGVDDPEICLLFRLETASSWHSNYYLHGVPDDLLEFGKLKFPWTSAVGVSTFIDNVKTYIGQIKLRGLCKSKRPPDLVTRRYDPITRTIFRGVTHRKVGRPFGASRGRVLAR